MASAASAAAGDAAVFLSSDRNPFIQVHGPPIPASAGTIGRGEWSMDAVFDLVNISILEGAPGETIVMDGETSRLDLMFRYGLSDRLDAGLAIPLVAHRGGVFDRLIFEWHEAFGLTNSARTGFGFNELHYAYTRDDHRHAHVGRSSTGVGDVRMSAAWRLHDGEGGRSLALHTGLKLPTGDERRLHGSGSTDVSLQVAAAEPGPLAAWDVRIFWTAGVIRLGDGGPLGGIRRDWVPLGSVAMDRPVGSRFVLKAQLDLHGSYYHSDLRALGDRGSQLVVGLGVDFEDAGTLDIGIIEDLFTDTTPDFGLHMAWRSLL